MTVSVQVDLDLNGTEVLDAVDAPAASDEDKRTLKANGFGLSATLDASSTPAAEVGPIVQEITIGSGTTTIDLTAAPLQGEGRVADCTGKKLIGYFFHADKDNSGDVTIAEGASNGYPLFGSGNDLVLGPGRQEGAAVSGVASPYTAVASGDKTLDISGTSGDKLTVEMIFGT